MVIVNSMISGLFIGNELCDGRIVNTNQQLIASELYAAGLYLNQSITIDDTLETLIDTLSTLLSKSEVIITTGGLGPTDDDRTTQAMAIACERPLIRDKTIVKQIQHYFSKTNRTMPKENAKQADFPQGATVIDNHCGTAPGYYFTHNKTLIICCPGVPAELEPMLNSTIIPLILDQKPHLHCLQKTKLYKCMGLGESHCAEKIRSIYPLPTGLSISFQAKIHEIQIRLSQSKPTSSTTFKRTCEQLDKLLSDYCYSHDATTSLAHSIIVMCKKKGVKLALAESCTGGLASSLLTAIPGASEVIDCTMITYSNKAKTQWLDVAPDRLTQYGAVSDETVMDMARSMQHNVHSDYCIAISGIAGPTGGTAKKPVGTVYFGLATKKDTVSTKHLFSGIRTAIQTKASYMALKLFYDALKHDGY